MTLPPRGDHCRIPLAPCLAQHVQPWITLLPEYQLTAEKSVQGFLDSPHWCIELFYASIATVRCLTPMTTSTTKATSSTATKESEILLDVIQRFASRHPA